uniref:Uncharacterized protein n=1 Tax=Populus davidiana TaxID=266767 RepID=A0A6M2EXM5_9ROSI
MTVNGTSTNISSLRAPTFRTHLMLWFTEFAYTISCTSEHFQSLYYVSIELLGIYSNTIFFCYLNQMSFLSPFVIIFYTKKITMILHCPNCQSKLRTHIGQYLLTHAQCNPKERAVLTNS